VSGRAAGNSGDGCPRKHLPQSVLTIQTSVGQARLDWDNHFDYRYTYRVDHWSKTVYRCLLGLYNGLEVQSMRDSVLTTANTTSNRSQEPDQSGSYVLAMPALQGGFPWTVSTSFYLAPRVHNIGVLVGYRIGA
jgi:hypothetical protein